MCRHFENSKILPKIGAFFLSRNNGDYKETERQIERMGITKVCELSNTQILIILRRPGLIIGKKGIILESLSAYIKRKIQIVEEQEQDVNDFIIPREFPFDDDWHKPLVDTGK